MTRHPVTGLNIRDALADFDDVAGNLVAGDAGKLGDELRRGLHDGHGEAHARRLHLDQHFAKSRRTRLALLQDNRPAKFVKHHRSHGSSSLEDAG